MPSIINTNEIGSIFYIQNKNKHPVNGSVLITNNITIEKYLGYICSLFSNDRDLKNINKKFNNKNKNDCLHFFTASFVPMYNK